MPVVRREALCLIAGALALPARAAPLQSGATASAFRFAKPEGGSLALAEHAGKPILVVNTATACGYAPQFAGLQQLWTRFGPRGLTVIAVPSPDFGHQEPLDGMAIAEAARKNHGVTFPVVAKTSVTGPQAHPFYRWAAAFATPVEPTDPRVIAAIVRELDAAG